MSQDGATFRAAAVQLSPVICDRDGTTEKVIRAIEACGREDVRLAVFPETVIPSYPFFMMVHPSALIFELIAQHTDQSVDVPGPVTEAVGAAARSAGTVVVLGVNERDGGSLYNTQLIFDADGSLVGKRRKIMPTYGERMIWGWGDGSGLRTFDTAVGRIGALICWEHYMPLARYALMAAGEQIHCSHFPGSMLGDSMSNQIDAAIRHHAMESGAFVVNATCWLSEAQRREMAPDEAMAGLLVGGLCTAIISPDGAILAGPAGEGEDLVVAEIDLTSIAARKMLLDTVGHYSRPDLLRLSLDDTPRRCVEPMAPVLQSRGGPESPGGEDASEDTPE